MSRRLVRSIRLPGIKLIEYPMSRDRWYPELFNLIEDPGEQDNLAEESFDIALSLHRELERWQKASGVDPDLSDLELDPDVEEALRELGYIDD